MATRLHPVATAPGSEFVVPLKLQQALLMTYRAINGLNLWSHSICISFLGY